MNHASPSSYAAADLPISYPIGTNWVHGSKGHYGSHYELRQKTRWRLRYPVRLLRLDFGVKDAEPPSPALDVHAAGTERA